MLLEGERVGYAVLMGVVDEAHLLNIKACEARGRSGFFHGIFSAINRNVFFKPG